MSSNTPDVYSLIDELAYGKNKGMAIKQLTEMGSAAFPALVGAYFKPQYVNARGHILRMLRDFDFEMTRKTFVTILQESELEIKSEAIHALATLGFSPLIQETLYGALESPEAELRIATLRGLARYPRSDESIISAVATRDPDPEVRRAAAYVLASFAKRRPIEPPPLQVSEPLLADAHAVDRDLRFRALDALVALRDNRVIDLLIAELESADARERYRILQLIEQMPSVKAVPSLIPLLGDPSYIILRANSYDDGEKTYLCRVAFQVIKRIGKPAIPYLEEVLKDSAQLRTHGLASELLEIFEENPG